MQTSFRLYEDDACREKGKIPFCHPFKIAQPAEISSALVLFTIHVGIAPDDLCI